MNAAGRFILLIGGLWWSLAATAQAAGPAVPFKLFTANCYCFDEAQTRALKNITWIGSHFSSKVKVVDLQRGIQKNTGTRRREIAQQVVKSGADVAFFQEVWNADNKVDMLKLLQSQYKYCYMTNKIKNSKLETDDGLFIVSKWPPFFMDGMEFDPSKKYDDEEHAHKGALIMGIYHPSGGFILLVNTHLQSGTDDESCSVRQDQITEIVEWIRKLRKTDWRIENATVIVGGDLNDPITIQKGNRALFDRTGYQVKQFNDLGININNDQTIAMLVKKYDLKEIWESDQQHRQVRIRTVGGGARFLGDPHNQHAGRFGGHKESGWDYFPEASEPSGVQLLDHLFLDPSKVRLDKFTVMRSTFLGDKAHDPGAPYAPYAAISDHAGVLFELTISPSL